jgi:4a-hydroxytetrahydrobiopterin dehydratase
MTEKLRGTEIEKRLKELKGWEWTENEITKRHDFPSFRSAIQFVNRVAELAEAADHHPDITINYRKVMMVLSTHSAGGLTQKDFALAKQIEGVVKT